MNLWRKNIKLILRVFISFTNQFFISNRVKCQNQILPSVGFEPTTSCILGIPLTAIPQRPRCCFHISHGIVRSLLRGPRGLAVRGLPRMQEVVRSNPTEGKICFSQFTLFYRVECEKLFCKTNIKLKVLKLNKTKFIWKRWQHKK